MSGGLWDVNAVAWWGAGLSSVLGAISIFDRYFKKPIPVTSYMFSTSHEHGNQISLINGTSVPVMVQHWEIFWGRPDGIHLLRGEAVVERDYDDLAVLVLQPYSSSDWSFTDQHHFGWKMDGKLQLYVELQVVGRAKPVIVHIYNSSLDTHGEPKSIRRLLPHALRPRPKQLTPEKEHLL